MERGFTEPLFVSGIRMNEVENMNFLNKMERKLGRYAIRNLSLYIIGTYILGYLLQFTAPNILSYLWLDPYRIFHGQVWRLVSWLLVPPVPLDKYFIFTIIMLYFYYSIGTTLERTWGTFRYNVYIFGGILATIIGAFLLYGISVLIGGQAQGAMNSVWYSGSFSTYYISLSIFLGFAMTYPNMQVLLMFVIPIKIKWLAYLDLLYLASGIYKGIRAGNWGIIVVILSSLANVIIFFLATRNYRNVSPKEIHRKQVYRKQVRPTPGITKHKCAICGRTEKDGDNLEFRFCSKCSGNYEYCQEHLFTHEHKR